MQAVQICLILYGHGMYTKIQPLASYMNEAIFLYAFHEP